VIEITATLFVPMKNSATVPGTTVTWGGSAISSLTWVLVVGPRLTRNL